MVVLPCLNMVVAALAALASTMSTAMVEGQTMATHGRLDIVVEEATDSCHPERHMHHLGQEIDHPEHVQTTAN